MTSVEERGGQKVWSFQSGDPVPFLNITVAPYRTLRYGGIRIFHFAADSSGARAVLENLIGASAVLEEWFGTKPEQGHITIIEIPEGFGSQASLKGGIIQTADAFRDRNSLPQLYHEMAHLWHPCDTETASPRWNEGLATFLQYRLGEGMNSTVSLDSAAIETASSLLARYDDESIIAELPMARYGTADITGLSYRVGHLMFYVLFRVLGGAGTDLWYRPSAPLDPHRQWSTVETD